MTSTADDTRILDCGHVPSPHSEHTTGTAHTPDGKEICWDCANREEEAAMNDPRNKRFTVYVGEGIVTTWTGYKLGTITARHRTTIFGRDGFAYTVKDNHGNWWHGRHAGFFSGKGSALNLTRCK